MPAHERLPVPPAGRAPRVLISRPGDASERAADAVAAGARVPDRGPDEAGDAVGDAEWAAIAPAIGGPGEPLDPTVSAHMQRRLDHDFSRVRVHADEPADATARRLGAAAYTIGDHIAFARGRYRPDHPHGRGLLAHELTHVVQQGARGTGPDAPVRIQAAWLIGDIFTHPGRAFERWVLGSDDIPPEELLEFLADLAKSGEAESDYDSDNKARAVVRLWKAGDRRFQLNPTLKKLLVRTMYLGNTTKADAEGILDILERSLVPDILEVFGFGGVPPRDLYGSFPAEQKSRFVTWLNQRITGGYEQAMKGRAVPIDGVSAAPYLNDETFRRRWDEALLAAVDELQSARAATPPGCEFPAPRSREFDKQYWKQVNIRQMQVVREGFELPGSSPYDAVSQLFANLDKWTCDCLMYAELAQLRAWHAVLSKEAFNAKFADFILGGGRGATTPGLEREHVDAQDDAALKAAPVGTIVVWDNTSSYAQGTSFGSEHAIKTFHGGPGQPERYAAHPFGTDRTEEQIRRKLAETNRDFPWHFQVTAQTLADLAADGESQSVITALQPILGTDVVGFRAFLALQPMQQLQKQPHTDPLLKTINNILVRARQGADEKAAAAYVQTTIFRDQIQIPK